MTAADTQSGNHTTNIMQALTPVSAGDEQKGHVMICKKIEDTSTVHA